MAQIKLLKIDADGVPVEFDEANDEITLTSFTVEGGGPVLDINGLSNVADIAFTAPSSSTINQTAGNLIIDDIMAKDRDNVMAAASSILFGSITDVGADVDAFQLPRLAAAPTATPSNNANEGYLVSADGALYHWNGTEWNNLNLADAAQSVEDEYTAEATIAARDVVYISSADNVSPALADSSASSRAVGFATGAATATDPVTVRKIGELSGFSGLTAGARYYLSAANAGEIVSSVPTGSGNTIVQVGYAKSTTVLDIQLQQLGRRA
jgi:hypothetical protein